MAGTSPAMTANVASAKLPANAMDLLKRGSALHFMRGLLVLRRRLCRHLLRTLDAIFEDNVTDRGVRGRHRIEAVDLVDLLIQRAAHDEPHHHLDALGASLAHQFEMREPGELLRVPCEAVEEG